MPKLPIISPQKLIKILEKRGFHLQRIKGSHHHFKYQELRTTVPVHNRDIGKGLLAKIIKQSGMTIDEFLAFFIK